MDNDNFNQIPANVSSIVDLLESKGISWGEYQQDMPSTGFTGFQFLNPDGANDYVRKHKWVINNASMWLIDSDNLFVVLWLYITP